MEKIKQLIKEAETFLKGLWLFVYSFSLIATAGATIWVILTQELRNEYRGLLTVAAVVIVLSGAYLSGQLLHRLGKKS
jgi:hypothetical protein